MLSIYAVDINKEVSHVQYNQMLSLVSDERRQQVNRFRFKKDALCALYGDILIRHLISANLRTKNDNISFLKNKYGKPYLEDSPLHFNLSHSGHWIIGAISNDVIGVDIEKMANIDLSIAKRFFTHHEYLQILDAKNSEKQSLFFSIWTLKESYLKYLGTGLSTPLDSFEFTIRSNDISLSAPGKTIIPAFRQLDFDNEYKLSVCAQSAQFPETVTSIDIGWAGEQLLTASST